MFVYALARWLSVCLSGEEILGLRLPASRTASGLRVALVVWGRGGLLKRRLDWCGSGWGDGVLEEEEVGSFVWVFIFSFMRFLQAKSPPPVARTLLMRSVSNLQ